MQLWCKLLNWNRIHSLSQHHGFSSGHWREALGIVPSSSFLRTRQYVQKCNPTRQQIKSTDCMSALEKEHTWTKEVVFSRFSFWLLLPQRIWQHDILCCNTNPLGHMDRLSFFTGTEWNEVISIIQILKLGQMCLIKQWHFISAIFLYMFKYSIYACAHVISQRE